MSSGFHTNASQDAPADASVHSESLSELERPYEIHYLFKEAESDLRLLVTSKSPFVSYDGWNVHIKRPGGDWALLSSVNAERMRDGGTTTMIGVDVKIYSPSSFRKSETPYWLQHNGLAQEIDEQESQVDLDAFDEAYDRIDAYHRTAIAQEDKKTLSRAAHQTLCDFYNQ